MTHKVLVYGTLRPGNTPTVMLPGVIYDLGWFPGLDLEGDGLVVCEVIEVDDAGLARLDGYEGYNPSNPEDSLYIRRRLNVSNEYPDVFVYEYNQEHGDHKVSSGDWLDYTKTTAGRNAHLGTSA